MSILMKLKVTKDEYYCYGLIPDTIDYNDLEIELSREEVDRIVSAYEEFHNAQQFIREKLEDELARG